MDKLEKAIKGLGCLAGDYDMESNKCAGCGYENCQTFSICIAEIARDALELLKAQEQKRGRWTTERTSDHDGEWYCSACGYEPIVMTDDMKFCPGCGAKMTMEGKENDKQ